MRGAKGGTRNGHWTQWRNQPQIFWGKYFEFKRATVFCLWNHLSRNRKKRNSRNFRGHGPFGPLSTPMVGSQKYGLVSNVPPKVFWRQINFCISLFLLHNWYPSDPKWKLSDFALSQTSAQLQHHVITLYLKRHGVVCTLRLKRSTTNVVLTVSPVAKEGFSGLSPLHWLRFYWLCWWLSQT